MAFMSNSPLMEPHLNSLQSIIFICIFIKLYTLINISSLNMTVIFFKIHFQKILWAINVNVEYTMP